LPPNATNEQRTRAYEEELAKTIEFWKKQQTEAHEDRTRAEDALQNLIKDKMKDVRDNEHMPGSLEFAFKEVLSAAGNITVNEDEDGDYFVVDDGSVGGFVQACENLLSICEMCQI